MAKLRRMLGSIDSKECVSLMRLIETQSKKTLAVWAISYAKENFLPIYQAERPGDLRLQNALGVTLAYINGEIQAKEAALAHKSAGETAREAAGSPVAQAAARAVATACATYKTPTNALGFLFYGAAAAAYSKAGLEAGQEEYDALATASLKKALDALREAAVADEAEPVQIDWHC